MAFKVVFLCTAYEITVFFLYLYLLVILLRRACLFSLRFFYSPLPGLLKVTAIRCKRAKSLGDDKKRCYRTFENTSDYIGRRDSSDTLSLQAPGRRTIRTVSELENRRKSRKNVVVRLL